MVGQAPGSAKRFLTWPVTAKEFRVWLPTKNKFLLAGRPGTEQREAIWKICVRNICWTRCCGREIRKEESVLVEEFNDEARAINILTVLRGGYTTEIYRKIWLIARLECGSPSGLRTKSALLSDVHVSDWQPLNDASTATPAAANAR